MSDRDEVYAQHLLDACRESVRRSEESEATYRARVNRHISDGMKAGRTATASEVRASTDSIVRGAASDGVFYRERAIMYGLAFLAELFAVEIEDETT